MRMHIMRLVDSCPSSLDSIFKIFGPGPKLSRASCVNDLMTALLKKFCPKTRHLRWSKIEQLKKIDLNFDKECIGGANSETKLQMVNPSWYQIKWKSSWDHRDLVLCILLLIHLCICFSDNFSSLYIVISNHLSIL